MVHLLAVQKAPIINN